MQNNQKNYKLGLIGKNISYSFSQKYFTDKFKRLHINNFSYQNFDLKSIEELPEILQSVDNLRGFNVTIPYKEDVLPLLDYLDDEAKQIGAVNTVKILENKFLKGYNTDVYGFQKSIEPLVKKQHTKALILGTGGASKAVEFVLKKMNIEVLFVSRAPKNNQQLSYQNLTKTIIEENLIIVNCTPLGTHPNINLYPDIPYQHITSNHICFDLIYNPAETAFLQKSKSKGATIKNGLKMLELQADKAWQIWNE